MRSLMAAVARVMRAVARAMRTMAWVVIQVGDRLISVLRPEPMPMIDQLEPEPAGEHATADTGSEFAPIRNLAYCRLEGRMPTPAQLAAAGKLGSEWVSTMTPVMLKSVLLADDPRLGRHLRGIEPIRGVLPFDEDAIDEYRIAVLRQKAAEETVRRTITPLRYA